MNARWLAFAVFCFGVDSICSQLYAQRNRDPEITLATTTSVRDAGLLREILPVFEARTGFDVKVLAVGSGQAMALGRQGVADILILHDPDGELNFVREGYAASRCFLMRNQFLLVGPTQDPALVTHASGVLEALRRIVLAKAVFLSRGDSSGTHVRERYLWALAGVDPSDGEYRESGQGMSATLQIANEIQAYTLVDIGTFLAHRSPVDLAVMVENDTLLSNRYHVLVANAERFPWINEQGALSLRAFLMESETQSAISMFGRDDFGRSLFQTNTAGEGARQTVCGVETPSSSPSRSASQ